ncbi:MAG TPA: hypothetical protein VK966_09685, partial [Longimicrobiales bacterium]|nr:hypothetical protein [Longimicrobiales bacterium]
FHAFGFLKSIGTAPGVGCVSTDAASADIPPYPILLGLLASVTGGGAEQGLWSDKGWFRSGGPLVGHRPRNSRKSAL